MAKIYFAAPMRGVREALKEVRELIRLVESRGHVVLTKHVAEETLDTDRGLSHREVFERDVRLLEEADMLIAEVSYPSLGVGFEIAYALLRGKKTVALVKHERMDSLSSLIRGITWENFYLVDYGEPSEAVEKLAAKGLI
ncbi:nucleoside 2-deoxyribosyltransferase [Infirmifilum lucidum]|uniref:Putative 2'-deoxynucleoside 5'-phosphate N-hydrolase 1 n=1 Tax=Infirmifilum lucidum TaxID=2776706 RepID=A0A7L9FI46_9CREN|nr:nucleoside 2-deoxyribosyltransferase [Infirmifilum lucidum]QOJ78594.1 nucleoside 2-deoxyribosyltransferase [Infirmifilum lucidum]